MEHFNKTILVRQDSQNDVESARIFDTEAEAYAAMMDEFKEQKFAFSRSGYYSINEEIGENYCWVEAECSDGPFSYVWSIMPGEVQSGFHSVAFNKEEISMVAHAVIQKIDSVVNAAKSVDGTEFASMSKVYKAILNKLTKAYEEE